MRNNSEDQSEKNNKNVHGAFESGAIGVQKWIEKTVYTKTEKSLPNSKFYQMR